MSQHIGIIKLRSALSAGDKDLIGEAREFLSSLSPNGEYEFENAGKGKMNVFLILTGGSETSFKDFYKNYEAPYFILPTGKRNSLAASLEIVSYLHEQGEPAILLYGEDQKKMLDGAVRVYNALHALRGARLGVIGGSSSWLIASNIDRKKAKKALGIDIVDIPMKEVLGYYDEHLLADDTLFSRFEGKTRRKEELREALYVHGALKKLVKTRGLSALTMKCFDLITAKQVSACLAFALLNEEGIIAGCEGDIPSALTMMIMQSLTGEAPFMANPAYMDAEHSEAVYAHCTIPISMLTSYTLATHFESGLSFALRGQLRKTTFTAAKLSPALDDIRGLSGQIIDNPIEGKMCRTQIKVRFNGSLKPLLEKPYGNHMIFSYGDYTEELGMLSGLLAHFCK